MNERITYLAMFEALDFVFWEDAKNQTDGFRLYLSGANPHLFAHRRSAVPWIETEFEEFYRQENDTKTITEEVAYRFVCRYLTKITEDEEVFREGDTDLCALFQRVSLQEWIDLCRLVKEKVSEGWTVPKESAEKTE